MVPRKVVKNSQLASDPPTDHPLVELRQVVKVYENAAGDFTALRGSSANVYPGEFLGIIGKSGAGKSTPDVKRRMRGS